MGRRLFTFFSLLSFALFTAAVVLWVRSQWTADLWTAGYFQPHPHPHYPRYQNGKRLHVLSRDGRLAVGWFETSCIAGPQGVIRTGPGLDGEGWAHVCPVAGQIAEVRFFAPSRGSKISEWAGVRYHAGNFVTALELPFAYASAAAAGLPLVQVLLLARTRRGRGLCLSCGYDLRATPERCPECGFTPVGLDR